MAMEVMVAGGPDSRKSEVMMEMVNKKRPFDSHFIDLLTIFVRSIIPPQTPGDLLRLLSTLLLGQVGSSLTFFITNQIKSKRIRTSRFRPPGMAVLNGKPTVMGGYEKGATPRDQDRVTFGIKGSELDTSTKDGPGHVLSRVLLWILWCHFLTLLAALVTLRVLEVL